MCVFIGNKKYGVGSESRRDANIKVRQLFACRISYFSEYSIWITYARMYFIPRNQFHVLLYRAKIIINACPQLCGFEYWIYDFFYYYYFSFFFNASFAQKLYESILKFVKFMIRMKTFDIFRIHIDINTFMVHFYIINSKTNKRKILFKVYSLRYIY